MLRIPLARFSTLILLLSYPGATAFRYVYFPLRWQIVGDTGRLQDFATAAVFLLMTLLLLRHEVWEYFKGGGGEETAEAEKRKTGGNAAPPPENDAGGNVGRKLD